MDRVRRWSCRVRVKDGADRRWACDSHEMEAARDGGDLVLEAAAENVKPDRNIVLRLFEAAEPEAPAPPCPALFSSARHEGSKYLMLRLRPELEAAQRPKRRDWIFLFESSADMHRGVKRGSYDTAGGMWAGLTVLAGAMSAKVVFRGCVTSDRRGRDGLERHAGSFPPNARPSIGCPAWSSRSPAATRR